MSIFDSTREIWVETAGIKSFPDVPSTLAQWAEAATLSDAVSYIQMCRELQSVAGEDLTSHRHLQLCGGISHQDGDQRVIGHERIHPEVPVN